MTIETNLPDLIDFIDEQIRRLKSLEKKQLVVEVSGNYPTKAKTSVGDVCWYQNNGTQNKDGSQIIAPSRFVERAIEENDDWEDVLGEAVEEYLFEGGGNRALEDAAIEIAGDISDKCDRENTGRLKHSFRGRVKRRDES